MELWEFNTCVRAYNKDQKRKGREQIAIAWQTASFVGAAFAGKLRRLSHYVKDVDSGKTAAPKVSKDEFEERLKAFEERRSSHHGVS